MDRKYILSLDQGTTSSRAIIFNKDRDIVATEQKEFTQIFPKSGWVEHDPLEIWESQLEVAQRVIKKANIEANEIAAIGISNQRETTVVWNKKTGKPIYNAIVWQCRRTADICEEIIDKGYSEYIYENTGLVIDAYFSGTKVKWILDHVDGAKEKALKGELLFGTIDSWILWQLTNGEHHKTDASNASRTMLFNIKESKWDEKILNLLDIPMNMMPQVEDTSCIFGRCDEVYFGDEIIIGGMAGDQQAALFGQCCFEKGMAKNTYGTGCFLLMNTGNKMVQSENGLLTTIAWRVNGTTSYALEGSIFMGGATIQWIRDELELISHAKESEVCAQKVKDTQGVFLVPAFTGLGAPYWDMYARGTIVGMTRGTNKNHIVRAALEAIAYQSVDVLKAMEIDSKIKMKELDVDGGATENDFLMQFQSDCLQVKVSRPQNIETTALGAAYFAGLAIDFWDMDALRKEKKIDRVFAPKTTRRESEKLYIQWRKAIERSKEWEDKG